jgi:hypothetical protein
MDEYKIFSFSSLSSYYCSAPLVTVLSFFVGYEPSQFFTCPKGCGRVYRHKGNMKRHATVECGIAKKFQCHLCPTSFHYRSDLKRHFEIVHRLEPDEIDKRMSLED